MSPIDHHLKFALNIKDPNVIFLIFRLWRYIRRETIKVTRTRPVKP